MSTERKKKSDSFHNNHRVEWLCVEVALLLLLL